MFVEYKKQVMYIYSREQMLVGGRFGPHAGLGEKAASVVSSDGVYEAGVASDGSVGVAGCESACCSGNACASGEPSSAASRL
jgi:hypothetical protein